MIYFLLLISFGFLFFDRLTKQFFFKNPVFFQNKLISLNFSPNPYLYFIKINQKILIIFSLIVTFVLIGILLKNWQSKKWLLTLGLMLIIAGGLSNLYDRIFLGFVVDWLWIFILPISVFNLADAMITLGCIFIGIYILKH